MAGYQSPMEDNNESDNKALVAPERGMAPITEKAPWLRYANKEPRNKVEAWLWETWFDLTGKRLP
jgi:hypothetical protein